MAITEASKRAHAKYMRKAYARLNVQYPAAYVEMIKAAAKDRGETLAGFVRIAIDKRLGGETPGHKKGKMQYEETPIRKT